MYCRNCGKKLDDGWKICPDCGTAINEENISDMSQSDDSKDTKVSQKNCEAQEKTNEKKKTYSEHKRRSFKRGIIIAGAVIVIYLLISIIGVALTGGIDDSETRYKSEDELTETPDVQKENEVMEPENTVLSEGMSWKDAYLGYLNENGNTDYEYSLDYIDEDNIPELVVNFMNAAEGIHICTYDGEKLVETPVGEGLSYRRQENLLCASGGRMDYYYDILYKMEDGIPVETARGEYGILDPEHIMYDEVGDIVYEYLWNGENVSEYEYYTSVEAFNYEEQGDIVCSPGRGYLYDIIEIVSHPLDITIMHPYLNDNGYCNTLNNYVIMFNGIDNDKINFSVTYDGELVGSASATIVDANTAEYQNANSDLTIKFDIDYSILEIEGYMGNIDLSGSYYGMWG